MLIKLNSFRVTEKSGWNTPNNGASLSLEPVTWYSNQTHFIENSSNINWKKLIEVVSKSTNSIVKGDIVYASKASEIPRFKLKEFIKESKLKKTSRYQYAKAIIINKGYFNTLLGKSKYGSFYFLNDKISKDTSIVDETNRKDWPNLFRKYPGFESQFNSKTHQKEGIVFKLYREKKLEELLEVLMARHDDIISGKCKIVFDEDLFVELNKEGIELDDEYLKILRDMLFSKDKDNIKLGFEMMSNLNLTQSTLLSISFLLNELIHTTNFRPSYYANTNTNLRGLLKLLKTKGIYWEKDWKTFGTGLRLNFNTGREGEIVKKFLLDNINREFKLSNSAADSLVDIVFVTETK